MDTAAKKIIKTMLEWVPLSAYGLLVRREVIGLLYHVVAEKPLYHVKHLYPHKSPEMFEADLRYLKRHHNLISYGQVLEPDSPKGEILPNSIILTFDDGYSECFSLARPLLLKHQVPCVFFVATDFVDNRRMFYRNKVSLCIERIRMCEGRTGRDFLRKINSSFVECVRSQASFVQWIESLHSSDEDTVDGICNILGIDIDQYLRSHRPYLTSEQINLLVCDGFTIGAHSKKHPRLSLLSSEEEIEKEIVDSCRVIMDLTGQERVPFAFPYGGDGIDRGFLERVISKYKFIGLMFDTNGLRKDKDFIVNRIGADSPLRLGAGSTSNVPELLRAAYRGQLLCYMRSVLG